MVKNPLWILKKYLFKQIVLQNLLGQNKKTKTTIYDWKSAVTTNKKNPTQHCCGTTCPISKFGWHLVRTKEIWYGNIKIILINFYFLPYQTIDDWGCLDILFDYSYSKCFVFLFCFVCLFFDNQYLLLNEIVFQNSIANHIWSGGNTFPCNTDVSIEWLYCEYLWYRSL